MPENSKQEHLKRFLQDESLVSAVHGFFLKQFLKSPENQDVQTLAAAWIAKDTFNAAWRELLALKTEHNSTKKEITQVGL